jgi:hypothetical protein
MSGNLNASCQTLVNNFYNALGGYFAYNLYDDCPQTAWNASVPSSQRTWFGPPQGASKLRSRRKLQESGPNPAIGGENDYPCPLNAYGDYLALPQVRTAIHVPTNAYFFDGDNGAGFVYNMTETNLLPFYAQAVTQTPLRVLVYNGDTDPCINSMLTQNTYFNYFASVGIPITQLWRPWTMNSNMQRMGGYVQEYANNKFAFLTIRGSGHMVPEFKPAQSQSFITTWLQAKDYLPYKIPS